MNCSGNLKKTSNGGRNKLDWCGFIEFWQQLYIDNNLTDQKLYYPYIKDLKGGFLDNLWLWKGGARFYRINRAAIERMKQYIEEIREFRKNDPGIDVLYEFSGKFFRSGVVYRVFFMHICCPSEYPIFDQHVFRAFIFLTTGKIIKTPRNMEEYKEYRKFVFKLHKKYQIGLRDIDKALMSFGQFLNNPKKYLK